MATSIPAADKDILVFDTVNPILLDYLNIHNININCGRIALAAVLCPTVSYVPVFAMNILIYSD